MYPHHHPQSCICLPCIQDLSRFSILHEKTGGHVSIKSYGNKCMAYNDQVKSHVTIASTNLGLDSLLYVILVFNPLAQRH